eukprot:TRINITY_DN30406_c0_g1_i2.p1 TRINITY_DN30406_c0_g1~~TRINITY_DN30406_c0_g1_i2.p1  ORF type:complete len:146 (+),score=32.49 TRINITY_DN30406_c0_g1_i2:90-527(+)
MDILEEEDLRNFKASVDVFISLHRSEGFGLAIMEMMLLGKPVIATNYSGNEQFMALLPKEFSFTAVPYTFTTVDGGKGFRRVYRSDQRWALPNETFAAHAMHRFYEDRSILKRYEASVAPLLLQQISAESAGSRMQDRLKSISER